MQIHVTSRLRTHFKRWNFLHNLVCGEVIPFNKSINLSRINTCSREVSSLSVLTPFTLTIRQRVLYLVCAGKGMKMFLAKKKQLTKYGLTAKKRNLNRSRLYRHSSLCIQWAHIHAT